MARIFISHSSADNAEALALRDWLVARGWDDLFLDIDPHRGLVSGQRWLDRLADVPAEMRGVWRLPWTTSRRHPSSLVARLRTCALPFLSRGPGGRGPRSGGDAP